MEYSQSLQKQIETSFKKNSIFENSRKNFYLFNFKDFNINQLLNIFEKEKSVIFQEQNSKKHYNKILEMIKSNFYLNQTINYFQLLFQSTFEPDIYLKRKDILSRIDYEIIDLKVYFKELKKINKNLKLPFTIYTLDESFVHYFYEKYNINLFKLSQKELEQESQNFDENSILVTDESILAEFQVFSKKDFEKILIGNIIKNNKDVILASIEILNNINSEILSLCGELLPNKIQFNSNLNSLKEKLNFDIEENFKNLSYLILNLEEETQKINLELKKIIQEKQVNLQGDELLELLNSGNLEQLKKKLQEDTKKIIQEKELNIIENLKKSNLNVTNIFSNSSYPLEVDSETKEDLLSQIERNRTSEILNYYSSLNELSYNDLDNLIQLIYGVDLILGLNSFFKKFNLNYPKEISNEIVLHGGRNIYIENAHPIDYAIGSSNFNLNSEKVSILTGANSGGKTTLLEMILQSQILTSLGLPIPASSNSIISLPQEVIYLKKFTGTQGSGAFEQTIRALIEIIDSNSSKLMLIDEFEAVTEPGAAAKILLMFLKQIKEQNTLTIAVSHLGKELSSILNEEKISGIRIDGISATGLDESGKLITNHQPQFYELGKSTPELILKRILQDNKFWDSKENSTRNIFENLLN